ncbi:helix-turn-helix domain-containing protein [Seongchinamella sediminis]|uniref:Helix-turn-helix domain-containing protein n=1 Tax=Seongchinamella sediminis TaxID=2283635 RepID=A0A3L7E2P9_9GAMM|nr:AraC family transcriptional regulator [Seongchinamella sediminis]RLQ23050.1 helix-turn-helix domain-containing protein [Seongchinamella sediminis]
MSDNPSTEHSVLGSFLLPIAQALRLRGLDPLETMEAVGIDGASIANPDWRLPQRQFSALMAHCVAATGDEAFGLLAAEQVQPQALRGLGFAWLASDTVYDGLKRLARFSKLVNTAANMRLVEEGDLVLLDLGAVPVTGAFHFAGRDYAIGMVSRMCALALGDFLAPVTVELERPRPQAPERWESRLASRVSFDCQRTRMAWYRSDILEPLVTGDPALARANDEQTQAYLDGFLVHSIARQVVDKIVEHLPDGPPSQQQIAEALHVSNRTLQRKLKEEGTSFMDLLQDTRLQMARKYLRHPNRSVVETAYLLGFSEPSTFSRAFKRWTGMAPADFRESAADG